MPNRLDCLNGVMKAHQLGGVLLQADARVQCSERHVAALDVLRGQHDYLAEALGAQVARRRFMLIHRVAAVHDAEVDGAVAHLQADQNAMQERVH